jgi:hypothetical protein
MINRKVQLSSGSSPYCKFLVLILLTSHGFKLAPKAEAERGGDISYLALLRSPSQLKLFVCKEPFFHLRSFEKLSLHITIFLV